MKGDVDVAAAAALLAEPARAQLVLAVIDDGPLAASELAARAGVAASTASGHLARLVDGGFLAAAKSGRHRHYRLADPAVAAAVEALSAIAPLRPVRTLREATRGELIRRARTCYDHLAGAAGVALATALEERAALVRDGDRYTIGENAAAVLSPLDLDLAALGRQRRPLVRACLDWSERRPHLAGSLGAAVTARLFELGCLERRSGSRAVTITEAGHILLGTKLGVDLGD